VGGKARLNPPVLQCFVDQLIELRSRELYELE
jgi:hypothetical protein